MNTRIGIVGSYKKFESFHLDSESLVPLNTKNIGNLMFRYAVSRDIGNFTPIDTQMDPAEVREKVDVVVYPMANNINPSFNMGPTARFIEQCKLPIMVIGLGAQAELGKTIEKQLPDGSVRFMSVIGEYCTEISVRGEFTASVIEGYGVKNTVVTGCPSNFINPNPALGVALDNEVQRVLKNGTTKTAIYSQLGGKNFDEPNIESEVRLYDLVKNDRYHYVHTFPAELIDYSRGAAQVRPQWKNNLRKKLDPETDSFEFEKHFRQSSTTFTSVEAWMEFSRSLDFSVGKRVHGCLNTIQSGTASALIVHDERTKELANTIGLPTLSLANVDESSSVDQMIEKVMFNGKKYDQTRHELFSRYKNIYSDSNVHLTNTLAENWALAA